MILISLFDKKACYYHPPMAYEHVTQALRSYAGYARKSPESLQVQFAQDYDLYDMGSFDPKSGAINSDVPHFIESFGTIVAEALRGVVPSMPGGIS